MKRFDSSSLLFLALPLVLVAAAAPTLEAKLKASEHTKIGKQVAAYFTALYESKGINESFSKATEAVDKSAKKLKGTDIMSCVDDWEAIMASANQTFHGYKDYKKKGKHMPGYKDKLTGAEGALFVPKKYSPRKGDALPLVIIVPDESEKPESVMNDHWQSALAQEEAILFVVKMPNNSRIWNEIGSIPDEPGGIASVMSAFGHLKSAFKVDLNRVFLAGRGAGTGAAISTAAAFPHLFAGVIGYGGVPEGLPHQNFTNVATLFLNGGTHATAFAEGLKTMGSENCTVSEGTDTDIWPWVAEQSREAYPAKLHFEPTINFGESTNWVDLKGFSVDEKPVLDASFDRAANSITIKAENVVKVQVYLNDQIADLSKPVKVTINGEEREQVVTRNRKTLMDLAFKNGDWGRVFVSRLAFDVPVQ